MRSKATQGFAYEGRQLAGYRSFVLSGVRNLWFEQSMLHQRLIAAEDTSNSNVHHLCVGFDCGRPVVGSD